MKKNILVLCLFFISIHNAIIPGLSISTLIIKHEARNQKLTNVSKLENESQKNTEIEFKDESELKKITMYLLSYFRDSAKEE